MTTDLWGFRDTKELEKSVADMPDSILKEQIALLGEKTEYVIYGKPTFITVRTEEIEYKIATIFNVIVPKLDDYSKTILIMYSNPESNYPVAITVNSSFEDDSEMFTPQYTCNDKESFVKAIKEILSSAEVLDVIKILYSKAAMLS
ncbi:hypothetical protein [Clostridium sp. KNHs216]|uniref:hypothetical protein n=1 Tax=Clostridium sp. KNHs216 TaxID=1550235 RepID=UPI0011501201|nr:hypothetical protein [Clostridium sp. KNHs216]TQI66188.1 hypothetical protein LY85_0847 [Clostridium sp. KNHs216]